MMKEDQLWVSERFTKEDKINTTWGMDSQLGRNVSHLMTASIFGPGDKSWIPSNHGVAHCSDGDLCLFRKEEGGEWSRKK